MTIDGHDFKAIDAAIAKAKTTKNGKPSIIIAKTIIGKGIPEVHPRPAWICPVQAHQSFLTLT